jgi:hypothetical protein
MNLSNAKKIVEDVASILRYQDYASSRVCAEALEKVYEWMNTEIVKLNQQLLLLNIIFIQKDL